MLGDSRQYCENTLVVKIGNISTTALVDTGATISCVSTQILQKINPKFIKNFTSDVDCIYGVGNKQHDMTAKVQLPIKINNQSFTNSFYALQNQYNIILGMDFITGNNAKIDFENSTINFNGVTHKLQAPPSRSSTVKLTDTVFIPPYHAQDVNVMLSRPPSSDAVLLESVSSLSREYKGIFL